MTLAEERFEVVVVGGGPAGASAASHCAQAGLETLLLERKRLPRDKVCSGMIMGRWAHRAIEAAFGAIPEEILADPRYLVGHVIHVPGTAPVTFPWRTPIAWREDLDGWMIRRAVAQGASLWEHARVIGMEDDGARYRLKIVRSHQEVTVSARFVVGAEGASSPLRSALFPDLQVRYSRPVRECYPGALALGRDHFHWFFPRRRPRPRFSVNHKDDVFILEGSGIPELRAEIAEMLSPHGFDPASTPASRDGCLIAVLHAALLAGRFRPARGRALLAGDAAGLILPITFEGIGTAVLSGRRACAAIVGALAGRGSAAEIYVKTLEPVVRGIARLAALEEELAARTDQGPTAVADALARAYQETARVQAEDCDAA
jgi:flavin-dependent dehydrogenase